MSDDRWRDNYDAWKLATPPEYEAQESEETVMATRYNVTVEREEYDDEASGKVMGRAKYRIEAHPLLQEAWDAVEQEVSKFGWFDDR